MTGSQQEYIEIGLRINTDGATNDISEFATDAKEKLDFSESLSQSIDSLYMSDPRFSTSDQSSPYYAFGNALLSAKNAVDSITSSLSTFATELGSGKIGEVTKHLYESSYREATLSLAGIANFVNKTQRMVNSKQFKVADVQDQTQNLRAYTSTGNSASWSLNKLSDLHLRRV